MKRGFANISLLLALLATVFGMVFASATSSINLPLLMASTDGSEGGEGGDSGGDSGGGDGGGSTDPSDDSGGGDEPGEPEEPDEPEPPADDTCQGGQPGEDGCPPAAPAPDPMPPIEPKPDLPICDGTPQDCITQDGNICLAGQGGHECECAEDMSDCPEHPGIVDPETKPKKPLPYCDKVPDDYVGGCHDRKDYDELTGLYPCNDGTQKKDWRNCDDAYVKPCDPQKDENCRVTPCPEPIMGIQDPCGEPTCNKGYELINGKCVEKDEKRDRIKIIVKNTHITEVVHKHDSFPEIDIIGLSIKDTGEAMVCMMNIDDSNIQCQKFEVPNDRINQNIWRVIETDHSKDYDNGNTGNSEIDSAISEIRSQQFIELEDRNNHDFGVDLAAVGINPLGDGLVCLIDDPAGTSLCEPFKVESAAISGQITEITEINS